MERLLLSCSCLSEVVVLDYWEPFQTEPEYWDVEFYTAVPGNRRWRDRARIIWAVLRGKEAWLEAAVFERRQLQELRDWCDACLSK